MRLKFAQSGDFLENQLLGKKPKACPQDCSQKMWVTQGEVIAL
jgi:hypothetical protein